MHNIMNYDLHFIMQELGKFNFKINVIPHGLEKYISFNINNKLVFINSFQILANPLVKVILSIWDKNFRVNH